MGALKSFMQLVEKLRNGYESTFLLNPELLLLRRWFYLCLRYLSAIILFPVTSSFRAAFYWLQ
jgi:hypothetical protein